MAVTVSDEDHEQRPNVKETRLKWTEKMKKDLLDCKRIAKGMVASNNPPRNLNGKKKGYMQKIKELWVETDHAVLNFTIQNLRDQAARLKKNLSEMSEKRSVKEKIEHLCKLKKAMKHIIFRMNVEFQEPELPIE